MRMAILVSIFRRSRKFDGVFEGLLARVELQLAPGMLLVIISVMAHDTFRRTQWIAMGRLAT